MATYTKGSTIKRTAVTNEHPNRTEVVKILQFCADCFTCKGGFDQQLQRLDQSGRYIDPFDPVQAKLGYRQIKDRTYLVRYSRESEGKFVTRVHQAYLPPYVPLRVIQPLVGFLTRNEPGRETYPDWYTSWMDEATIDGLGFDEWLRIEGIPWGLVYPAVGGYPGGLPIVIDSDSHEAETEAEREALGAKGPRLRTVHPDRLLDWGLDDKGKLDWIKYETDLDIAHPVDGHSKIKRIRWITPQRWWYVDLDEKDSSEEVAVTAGGPWPPNFTKAPLATISFLSGAGIVYGMAPMIHRLFNVLSEKTEGQRAGCFSILAYPTKREVDALTLGTMNALPYDPESRGVPQFLTPDMAPLEHLKTEEDGIITKMQEIGGTASVFGAGAEAAATMAYRFQTTARFLDSLAGDISRLEYAIGECVGLWEGQELPEKMERKNNLEFDAVDKERFLEEQTVARDGGFLTPTAKKVQSRKVITVLDFWGDDDEREQIETELDEGVEAEKNPPPPPIGAMDGDELEDEGPVPAMNLAPKAPPVPARKVAG